MISAGLIQDGVPSLNHLHHHHRHLLPPVGSPLQHHPTLDGFNSLHHLTATSTGILPTFRPEQHPQYPMSTSTFVEPFLKTPSGSTILPHTEFLRPLPKPAPIVATRYNGVTFNGSVKSRLSSAGKYLPDKYLPDANKFPEDPQGPVNLVQPKDNPSDSRYGAYTTSPRLFPASHATYYPPPSIQTGPYGTLYSPGPYTPVLHRDNRSAHLLPLQQYPNANTPILKSPTSHGQQSATTTIAAAPSEAAARQEKRPFKVPSGKEGSLKHRILTRPEIRPSKKSSRIPSFVTPLPPPANPSAHPQSNNAPQQPDGRKQEKVTSEISSNQSSVITSCGSENNGGVVGGNLQNFSKGSLIQLANGKLKKVEDMEMEDFFVSAEKSNVVQIDPSIVVRIQENKSGTATLTFSYRERKHQVDYETLSEHPYFVFGRGWSSCRPAKTLHRYGLQCHQLQVGDICVSLSPRTPAPASRPSVATAPRGTVKRKLHPPNQNSGGGSHISKNNIDTNIPTKMNDLRITDGNSNSNSDNNCNRFDVNDKNNNSNSDNNNSNSKSDNRISNKNAKKFGEQGDSNNNVRRLSPSFVANGKDSASASAIGNRKKRRWSAPDHLTEKYRLHSPVSKISPSISVPPSFEVSPKVIPN